MIYRQSILTALQKHGALGLMDLRRKVSGLIGAEASRKILKEEVRELSKSVLAVRCTRNGFLISIKEPTDSEIDAGFLRRQNEEDSSDNNEKDD